MEWWSLSIELSFTLMRMSYGRFQTPSKRRSRDLGFVYEYISTQRGRPGAVYIRSNSVVYILPSSKQIVQNDNSTDALSWFCDLGRYLFLLKEDVLLGLLFCTFVKRTSYFFLLNSGLI